MENSEKLWTGKVPDNWKFYKGKYIFGERSERGNAINLQLLSPTQKYGVIPQSMYDELTSMKSVKVKEDTDLSTFKTIHRGDFCISLRSFQGGFEYSEYEGVVSPAYHVLFSKMDICAGYYKYLFKEQRFIAEMNSYCQSLRDGKNISYFDFGRTLIPFPPLSEQQSIADYLDETCSKIDEIIAEAKASIDEYRELKQSVIFEAVTKGLDKNINVYKTGNSWIPLLPAGVKLSRFGLHHDIILGKMLCPTPRNEEDTLEPYYCAANVHFDGVTGELKTMWFNSKEKETYVVHKNDMLIVEGGAGAGGAAIMNEEPPVSTFVQNSIMIVRSHMKDNRYSCYLVQALVKNKYVDVVCNKATIPHFTKEKVSCMPYPVFNRNERNEIANYLDERCKQIDSLISEKESLINDLEAYKKSLIYEVVTGKRRVV